MVVTYSMIAFILCILLIVPIRHLALFVGLVDVPDRRKIHIGNVPVIGGLAIFSATSLVLGSATPPEYGLMMGLASLAMVLLGMLDDMFGLRVSFRLCAQIGVIVTFVIVTGTTVQSLDNIFGSGTILFSPAVAVAFTLFSLLGVINATNMIDGLDGLLGVVSGTSLVAIGGLAYAGGYGFEAQTSLVLAAAMLGFLLYNFGIFGQSNKVFCGDSGSMMIGFVLATLCVRLTQGENAAFDPVVAGWLFGIPLVDTVVVIFRRIAKGNSPFKAGRDHIHHYLLNAGFSPHQSLLILTVAHLSMIVVGLLCHTIDKLDAIFFWLFALVTIAHFILTPHLLEKYMASKHDAP